MRLLEATLIRVGNEEYARENRSYGLTTLRNRHVDVQRHASCGSSSAARAARSTRSRCAIGGSRGSCRRLQELPGQEVFQYLDEDGARHSVDSDDVNAYLREITGEEFSAKDFRTWAGTVLCAVALREVDACASETEAKRNVAQVVKEVAQQLGNTPAVCRSCYVHPAVIEAYFESHERDAAGEGARAAARRRRPRTRTATSTTTKRRSCACSAAASGRRDVVSESGCLALRFPSSSASSPSSWTGVA